MKSPTPSRCLALAGAAAMLALTACSADNPWEKADAESGTLDLSLTSSAEVKAAVPQVLTRADAPDVPDPENFSITLSRVDGTWSRTYATLEDFRKEATVKTGAYILRADYGSLAKEGFESPYYTGEAQVTVLSERTTPVELTATIGNSLVSIDYTEAFRQYFQDWGATVHTEGYGYNTLGKEETRPAYIAPGTTDIIVDLTDRNGRSVQLKPCSFQSEARTHYKVTFDVNGGQVGVAQLTITFDDSLTREDVNIDLTDELFTTPAPTVDGADFASGATFEAVKGESTRQPAKLTLLARGGLSSAVLTFRSETFTPPFGTETELCNAPQNVRDALCAMGIDAKGFFTNPGQMALLDLSGLTAHLPLGRHSLTLVAKDMLDRASEPFSIEMEVLPLDLTMAPATPYGSREATLNIEYNGQNPASDLSFKAMNDFGQYVEAPVTDIAAPTRAIETKSYRVTIALPATERTEIPVKVFLRGEEHMDMLIPVYQIETDALADNVRMRIKAPATAVLRELAENLQLTLSGPGAEGASMSRDAEQGTLTITGLSPASDYAFTHSSQPGAPSASGTFTTEREQQIPNQDFSELRETINIPTIQVGGQYKVSPSSYSIKSSILVDEPQGWASVNEKTAWSGSANLNSWFVVPSTLATAGEVTLRSVAYDHSGTTPSTSGGAFNTTYYCTNTPSSFASRAAGELFLGSYSYDGSEHRSEGIAFGSRPASISFDYTYAPLYGEKGVAEVSVLDHDGTTISSTRIELDARSDKGRATLTLGNYPFGRKAASLRLRFLSSNAASPATNVPTGKSLSEGLTVGNFTNPPKIAANAYHALSTGSELKVSNVSVNYTSARAAKPARRSGAKKAKK